MFSTYGFASARTILQWDSDTCVTQHIGNPSIFVECSQRFTLIFKNVFIYLFEIEEGEGKRERGWEETGKVREKKRFSVHCFIAQMTAMAMTGPGLNQECQVLPSLLPRCKVQRSFRVSEDCDSCRVSLMRQRVWLTASRWETAQDHIHVAGWPHEENGCPGHTALDFCTI